MRFTMPQALPVSVMALAPQLSGLFRAACATLAAKSDSEKCVGLKYHPLFCSKTVEQSFEEKKHVSNG